MEQGMTGRVWENAMYLQVRVGGREGRGDEGYDFIASHRGIGINYTLLGGVVWSLDTLHE